jgi:hypothetical protein
MHVQTYTPKCKPGQRIVRTLVPHVRRPRVHAVVHVVASGLLPTLSKGSICLDKPMVAEHSYAGIKARLLLCQLWEPCWAASLAFLYELQRHVLVINKHLQLQRQLC